MPMEVYYEKLVEHLQEAKDRFVFSPEDEGVHHIALKLYAYAHYATIRDCLGIPTDIKYECPKGYYPFDLLVSGLSYIDPNRNIGIECISRKSYLLRPSIIEEKISKAHYHLRMHDISRFEIYLEPSFETEKRCAILRIKLGHSANLLHVKFQHIDTMSSSRRRKS
ncbi:MAG: hypothetical protein QXU46_05970 [Candidatus Bathyarchaeia archaeon]